MPLKKRPATIHDLQTINDAMGMSKAYWGYDEDFMAKFMARFRVTADDIQNSVIYLVYLDTELLGYYSFMPQEGTIHLDMFFVLPKFIGGGYGRRLWHMACQTAKSENYSAFQIIADPNANGFYEKMGCQIIRQRASEPYIERLINIYQYVLV